MEKGKLDRLVQLILGFGLEQQILVILEQHEVETIDLYRREDRSGHRFLRQSNRHIHTDMKVTEGGDVKAKEYDLVRESFNISGGSYLIQELVELKERGNNKAGYLVTRSIHAIYVRDGVDPSTLSNMLSEITQHQDYAKKRRRVGEALAKGREKHEMLLLQ